MPVVRKGDCRNITTPGATMTTFASPTLGAAASALWRVDMTPGSQGPSHTIDSEQIWTIIDGCATIEVADETHRVEAGDTVEPNLDHIGRVGRIARREELRHRGPGHRLAQKRRHKPTETDTKSQKQKASSTAGLKRLMSAEFR